MCFEQQQPDHEAALDAGPTLLAVKRRDLAVEPVPVDALGKLHQLVPHVDDLVEPRSEQIARARRGMLLRPHRTSSASPQATESRRAIQQNRGRPFCKETTLQSPKTCNPEYLLATNQLTDSTRSNCSRATFYQQGGKKKHACDSVLNKHL